MIVKPGRVMVAGVVVALLAMLGLLVAPAVLAQNVTPVGGSVYCGVASVSMTQFDRSRSPVMMTFVSQCPAGSNLAGGAFPTAFVGDTEGWFHSCAFGAKVTDLRWAQNNGAYDANLPIDSNNPEFVACDPNVSPTVLFKVWSGPDGTNWNKVTDVGAICNAIVDPNDATTVCERQDFTSRTYSRYVKLGWTWTADPNVAGHDPNCAISEGEASLWMSCAR